ncbi:MAG: hypothetical protein RLZZ293_1431 [Pseudomonadota bacterium]|jgi:hypothetical protein
MKKSSQSLIASLVLSFGLVACNAGSNTNSSDVQSNSNAIANEYSYDFTATGCKTITAGGTCSLTIRYMGNTNYSGNLGITLPSGYSSASTPTTCTISSTSYLNDIKTTCNFTITASSNAPVNTANSVILTIASQNIESNLFTIGGGL